MEFKPASAAGAAGSVFNVFERLVLFVLSLAVGVVNLLIALAVAAHLGVFPKETSASILRVTSRAAAVVTKALNSAAGPEAPRSKAKPAP
jgi:hypothetical protein